MRTKKPLVRNLLSYLIILNSKVVLKLLVVEKYHNSFEHLDPFVHRHKTQKEAGRIYQHEIGRGGLDVTFGSKREFLSFLMRETIVVETGEIIRGPKNIEKFILNTLGIARKELRSILENRNIFGKEGPIYIEVKAHDEDPIFSGPRVGLTLKKKKDLEDRKKFWGQDYRFCTRPDKDMAEAGLFYIAQRVKGYSMEEARDLFGFSITRALRYEEQFIEGLNMDINEFVGSPLTKQRDKHRLYGSWVKTYAPEKLADYSLPSSIKSA